MTIHVGDRIRIADAATLGAALGQPAGLRPEPGQMTHAGRAARVTGYRRTALEPARYVLDEAPGLWAAEWLVPVA